MTSKYSATRIAHAIAADPAKVAEPTAEQRAIIESPPTEVALVVAGAGSGKTETMANRVLWLLANGHVQAHEIVGLTFTRKAASELSERINLRIDQLVDANILPEKIDAFSRPTVTTYNAFASSVFRDHAARIGWDADAQILTEASAWSVAFDVVRESRDPRLAALDVAMDTVVAAVLSLARDMREHGATPESVRAVAADLAPIIGPPDALPAYGTEFDRLRKTESLPLLVDLAVDYQERKRRRGFMEFSDQVALATRIVREFPEVARSYQARFSIVLLDEYQDTSVGQAQLLSALFPAGGVMAVGDPNQAIYGWRGASASNLGRFHEAFGAGPRYQLSMSWRNGHQILGVANHIIAENQESGVSTLVPADKASNFAVESAFAETSADEAELIAAWFQTNLQIPTDKGETPSAAVLVRRRADQTAVCAALRAAGVPYHVLGLGGLLEEPAIADLVCGLAVISNPMAGAQLVRLLAGARWRVGAADLYALHQVAGNLSTMFISAEARSQFRDSVAADEAASLVDALDYLVSASWDDVVAGVQPFAIGWPEPRPVNMSREGFERLQSAARTFRSLRGHNDLPLADVIDVVSRALNIEVEALSNPNLDSQPAFEAFSELVHAYRSVAESPTLAGFLRWLREVENRENVTPRSDPPEAGTVQIVTMHSAKGLEWDLVSVPRLVEKTMPGEGQGTVSGWLAMGALPYPLRGDAQDLPRLAIDPLGDRKATQLSIQQFGDDNRAHHRREETRLMYVAATRARHKLLLSGSLWKPGATKPTPPSDYLVSCVAAGLIPEIPTESASPTNPTDATAAFFVWPTDPLGSATRRAAMESAAERVMSVEPRGGEFAAAVDRVLAESARHVATAVRRIRVPASQYAELGEASVPDSAEPTTAAIPRPVPTRPYRAARLGTRFHSWAENWRGLGVSVDSDAEWDESDIDRMSPRDVSELQLQQLKDNFAQSEWAKLTPLHTEIEILHPVDGRIIVCKIDAVFTRGDRIEIVDWKTGKQPKDAAERAKKVVQLALYRRAYAAWSGVAAERIDATLYYVADDAIMRLTADELGRIPEMP